MKVPSSHDLIHATSGGGACRFGSRGDTCFRICLLCDAEFEQTEEGRAAMKQHEFEHGMGTLFDWSEIAGKSLRMVVVPQEKTSDYGSPGADLYGIDDETGTVYHLCYQYVYSHRESAGGWKWKIGNPTKRVSGQKDTPVEAVLRLIGSANSDAK